ncbi:MAG: hypothetical protein QM777_06540 [Pseudorhodoferax sp.]
MHEHAAGRDQGHAGQRGQLAELPQPQRVVGRAHQFDGQPQALAEQRAQATQCSAQPQRVRRGMAVGHAQDLAVRQRHPVVIPADAVVALVDLLMPARVRDEFAQLAPAREVVRQHHEAATGQGELAAGQEPECTLVDPPVSCSASCSMAS